MQHRYNLDFFRRTLAFLRDSQRVKDVWLAIAAILVCMVLGGKGDGVAIVGRQHLVLVCIPNNVIAGPCSNHKIGRRCRRTFLKSMR